LRFEYTALMRTLDGKSSWSRTRLLLAAVALMLLLSPPSSLLAQATGNEAQGGAPVVIARARQYDIKSKINGLTYRVMILAPVNADPAIAYPVMYLLDGNATFPKASPALNRPMPGNAILVGIGYPTDDQSEFRRRRFVDLTPSVSKTPVPEKTGGGDAFFRVLEDEVKPFVMARYHIDRTKQTIYGHSLGGLFVLRALFRNPNAYSAYIISSPSIWYNDKEVLRDEEAFSKRARVGDLRLKVLVTSAGDEQYRGADPKLLAEGNAGRMVDNASELADRLALLDPKNIPVTRVIFPGETHGSVQGAALSRAVRFALPPE